MSKEKTRYVFAAVVCVAVALGIGIYACTRTQERSAGPLVKVRFADAVYLPSAQIYVALEKGYFKQERLDVSYSPFVIGREALREVVAGAADFATAADTPIVVEALKGTKICVIATLSSTPGLAGIIARRDQGISSVKDLQGKKIGVTKGTNSEFILDSFLLFYRVPREDIQVVDLLPQGMADAFGKGEIQAALTWEPTLSRLVTQLGANAVIFYGDEQRIYKQTWNIAAMQEFARNNPETVKRVVRALLKADAFIQENRKEARQIISRSIGVNEDAFETFWKSYRPAVSLDPLLILNMESQTRWLMKKKLTDKIEMPNYLDYIYFRGLESVKPEALTIVH
jgi:ABC-type nitrate/sulfonate/bicarbonate transport system substrate-binding protein